MNEEEKDIFIREKLKEDTLISKKAEDLYSNIKNLDMDKEKIDNKETKKKNKNLKIMQKIISIAACAVILLGGANIYATTQGYDNIFFMIKEKITSSNETKNKDEILSDRDITISYKYIEIAKGLKLQVSELLIKNNEAKLYLNIDTTNSELNITPFRYKVKDENGNLLCDYSSSNNTEYIIEELLLKNYNNDTKLLELEIIQNNETSLVTLKIDLENRTIEVIGNEEEIEKISEQELKEYLSIFSLINYKDQNLEKISEQELNNERKMMMALELSNKNNFSINQRNNNEYYYYQDTDLVNEIIESFTNLNVENDGLMKLGNVYYGKELINGSYKYINNNKEYATGLCIDVRDIMYSQGIYTVTFTYCYPHYRSDGLGYADGVEDLPIYEMTLGFTINSEQEYSKYHITTWEEGKLIQEGKIEDNQEQGEIENENENNANTSEVTEIDPDILKFVGNWKLDYALNSSNNLPSVASEVKLMDLFTSNNIIININTDGTYTEYRDGTLYQSGTFEKIDSETLKLNYQSNNEDNGYITYSTNQLGENVISRVNSEKSNINEYYVTDTNTIKKEFEGTWTRTFNVDHEEEQICTLTVQNDGRFIIIGEDANKPNIVQYGTYELSQEYGWDIMTLKYNDGKTQKFLYSKNNVTTGQKIRKLHYSEGKQVFSEVNSYSSFDSVG